MIQNLSIYDEVASFMASMNPAKVIAFKASAAHQKRLDTLLDKQKDEGLTPDEKSEIEHYLMLNRIIGLAKARAINLLDAEHLVRFFNPRKDNWHEHFELQEGVIYGKTEIGESTIRTFKFNDVDRIIFRQQLIMLGHYANK
ncbi:MAG: hypothetical protein U5L45_01230 [Saprospiraceae bacterium]|nr:hypothetical protein [Saprospiraceae bacterium]